MDVGFKVVDRIIKTLPIGYYVGRRIPMRLSDTAQMSSYEMLQDRITISYPSIERMMSSAEKVSIDVSNEYIEEIIRSVCYHEVSHALFTPKTLIYYTNNPAVLELIDPTDSDKIYQGVINNFHQVVNVFEDERIEKIGKYLFYNTDFEEVKLRMMPEDYENQEIIDYWYDFIRMKIYPVESDEFEELNKKVRRTLDYSHYLSNSSQDRTTKNYAEEIGNLFLRFEYLLNQSGLLKNKDEPDGASQSNDNRESSDNSEFSDDKSDNSGSDKTQSNEHSHPDQTPEELLLKKFVDKITEKVEELKKSIENKTPIDPKCYASRNESMRAHRLTLSDDEDESYRMKIDQIIKIFSKTSNRNSSAITAYSGVFSPRLAGNSDYRFWVQENRSGHLNAVSKIKLNLFLDRSGSFGDNEGTVNRLLRDLISLSKTNPRFSVSLVTLGIGSTVEDLRTYSMYTAYDGTAINHDKKLNENFIRVQDRNARNVNLVLIDGDANYSSYQNDSDTVFTTFNRSNTILIVDRDNKRYLDQCPKARVTLVDEDRGRYSELLIENILTSLKAMAVSL